MFVLLFQVASQTLELFCSAPEKVDATKMLTKMDWTSGALRHQPGIGKLGTADWGAVRSAFFIRGIRILTFFQRRQQQHSEHLLHFAGSQCSDRLLARTELELTRSVFLLLLKVSPSGVWVCVLGSNVGKASETQEMSYVLQGGKVLDASSSKTIQNFH